MHNGGIRDFGRIKRRLRASLPDPLYNMIGGTTDSEHAFAVFLHLLGNTQDRHSAAGIGKALVRTIAQLEGWSADAGCSAPSYYNFAVTDGQTIAAVRYVSDPRIEPQSLYYSSGGKYRCSSEGVCSFYESDPSERAIVLASERLNENPKDWTRVAPNHVLTVTSDLTVNVELMDVMRLAAAAA